MFRFELLLAIGLVSISSAVTHYKPLTVNASPTVNQHLTNVSYRLPTTSVPQAYNIEITWIDEQAFTFDGKVTIEIQIKINTDIVVVHNRQLVIKKVTLKPVDGPAVAATFETDPVTEFLTVKNNANMKADSMYTLEITYSGVLGTGTRGFFRQSYVAETGETRWLATTHFEPTYARSAFPCYDEPQIKAKFTISIIHQMKHHTISNMKAKGSIALPGTNNMKTTFIETLPTSTYLIAFATSDFNAVVGRSNSSDEFSKTLVRVFCRPHWIGDTVLALKTGIDVLAATGRYLGIPYALDKIDQIAGPKYNGAMENWGLVTYPETRFFWNANGTYKLKEGIVAIIAHEFSHNWFGNLVGTDWWEFLWLKEGFANYFEYKTVNLVCFGIIFVAYFSAVSYSDENLFR